MMQQPSNKQLIEAAHLAAKYLPPASAQLMVELATRLDVHTILRNEAREEAIPDGYVLVPQEMRFSAESMEGICYHCGDGGHMFGDFTDGVLYVGEVDYGDGKKIHGLHIATADYPEEGCATICEFLPVMREGKAGEVQS